MPELTQGDKTVISNLRQRWPKELAEHTDEALAREYRHFSMSDMYGNNDERFIEWMEG